MTSQLTEGHAQQQGCHQDDRAGGQGLGAVAVTVTAVRPIAVVAKATFHLGSGVAAVRLVTEGLVCA